MDSDTLIIFLDWLIVLTWAGAVWLSVKYGTLYEEPQVVDGLTPINRRMVDMIRAQL